jgi:O-antigen/teichoic acid export membrane protein
MAGTSYAVVLPMLVLAGPLVMTLYGAPYANAVPVLSVLVLAQIFVSLGVARTQQLVVENRVVFSMFATTLGALSNVALNLILIPQYGAIGAAWATIISYALSGYFSTVIYGKLRPVFIQLSMSLLIPLRITSMVRSVQALLI